MNIVTLAQYCFTRQGHDLAYHQALHQLKGKNREIITYLPQDHTIEGLSSEWERFFGGSQFKIGDYARMYKLADKSTLFFLETFTLQDCIAFLMTTLWCLSSHHYVCVLYRDGKEWSLWRRWIQRGMSWCLQSLLGDRYVMLTDSELVARSMNFKNKQAIVLPIPHVKPSAVSFEKPPCLILWFPGAPREEKGIHWVHYLAREREEEGVLLMVSKAAQIEDSRLKIEWLEPLMSRQKYEETLKRAHVILLPYDNHIYQSRTSGPFVEAIVAGKWVLVTEGTWMAHELLRFGLDKLIMDWENPFIFKELGESLQDRDVQEKFREMVTCYQQFHSQENFEVLLRGALDSLVGNSENR